MKTFLNLVSSRRMILLAILALSLVIMSGCTENDGDAASADSTATTEKTGNDSGAKEKKKPKKEKSIKVNVGSVTQGDLVLPVFADGAIRTPKSLLIKTKVSGELLAVLVRDGDQVRKGQVLARIDAREYEIALEESRYRHLQALSQMAAEADTFTVNHAAMKEFTIGRDKLEALYKRGGLSREEYKSRLLKLEMDSLNKGAFREAVFQQRTGLAEARMAEERAELNLEYTEIKAPFSGIIQGMTMVAGEIVSTGTSVCTIFNNDNLEAVINVLEADLGNLSVGRPVLLAVPATSDTLQARIDVISPTLDAATRTCEVIIRFENPEGKFRPGMFVRTRIAGWVYPDKLLVPKSAILIRDNRTLVFKKDEDRAKWLYVDTGLQNDDWVEILAVHSGGSLSPGDEVVISDHLTLAHEAKIKVRKRIPPTNRWGFADFGEGAAQ